MTTQRIKQAAVIGAGAMGSQIAAVIANADTKVLLLDIVPRDSNDRDQLAKTAIEKLKNGKSALSEKKAENIQPGNMEDDLDKLKQADWVIECVPENEKIKHETYEKVGAHTDAHTLISSNTSTIPLAKLKEGLDKDLQKRLAITHFFNPPSKMPLLELVSDQDNDAQAMERFADFADRTLGRHVVMAKDTPGFIANRIGMFWMLAAMEEAAEEELSVETADAVMNGAFGFPKTGVFGLADLIGLKLIPDIAQSMCEFLPKEDGFCQLKDGLKMVQKAMKKEGFHRKGNKQQTLDLKNGEYREAKKANIEIEHWHEFLSQDAPESRFARRTLVKLLGYTARVSPDIADSILDVDAAMRDGYGWKQGPFEMIDRLGASWLAEQIVRDGGHPPVLLKEAEQKGFYPEAARYLAFSGRYRTQKLEKGKWSLALKTAENKPVLESETAKLWDIGDGIACLEFTSKMGAIDERTLEAVVQAVEKTEAQFQGMIIGHDGKHFSAGLDLHVVLESAKRNNWNRMEDILKQGQEAWLRVKTARVPVIPGLTGYALGGACELTMHCIAAQAHVNTHIGLVETGIGVIPAWGGTKEHLLRAVRRGENDAGKMAEQLIIAFRQIATAQKSKNAEDALAMGLLSSESRITANRERLLPDAKSLCLALSKNYQPRPEEVIEAPVAVLYKRLEQEVTAFIQQEQPGMKQPRCDNLRMLASVLSGHAAVKKTERKTKESARAGWDKLSERQILDSTREAFMERVQTKEALEKIRKIVKS